MCRINSLTALAACCLSIWTAQCLAVPRSPEGKSTAEIATPSAVTSKTRSISKWAACDGTKDAAIGVASAFAAAKNGAFTLLVDCPVFIHIGMDITRPIFIYDGTTVRFTENGLFIIDDVMIPAFVMANASSVELLDWRIKYVGGEPVNWETGGYYKNGVFVSKTGKYPAPAAFNDSVLTPWLTANRGIVFNQSRGHATAPWTGPTDTSSVFYVTGNTSNVHIKGLRMFVPPSTDVSHFIPVCFVFWWGYNSNQTIDAKTPIDANHLSLPNNIEFTDIDLDGYYMGWQGKIRNAVFQRIRAHRYGDLQDSSGGNVGGIGKWFAPPHLFYISYDPAYRGLENRDIHISDVIDFGNRVGVARDKGGSDTISGYANSLKFGAINSTVDNYKSDRPDGLMDVLNCDNLTISNVEGTYDSSFIHNVYPGIRFPSTGYKRLTIENVTLTDKASNPIIPPVGSVGITHSEQITLKNVNVKIAKWSGSKDIHPYFMGEGHHIDIKFDVSQNGEVKR
jgi:hypothetical protein